VYFVDRFFLATSHERHNFFWRSMKPGNKLESLEFECVGWVMDNEKHWPRKRKYQPEAWRDDSCYCENRDQNHEALPAAREQTQILELLGRINYKIIQGNRVYVEVDGIVYKTLYGGYWRSVFTGVEHYLLRCEQVSGSPWADDDRNDWIVDLPIAYSNHAWTANGHSLSYMLSRD
jgi:hypothetical protein